MEESFLTSTLSEEVTFNCEARKTREIAPTTTTLRSVSDTRSRRRNTFKIKKFFYQRRIVTLKTPLLASREVAREIFGGHMFKRNIGLLKEQIKKTLLSDNTRTLLFLGGETLETQVFACSILCLYCPPCSLPDCLNGVKSER